MEEPVRVTHRLERSTWFSAVGKAIKFLFGTLDEETEKEIKNLIARSDARVTELSKLLINQTEIVYKEQVRETAELVAKSVPDARFPISYENGTLADLVRVADL